MNFREYLNEGRVRSIKTWDAFVKKSIQGTGGHAHIWVDGDWGYDSTDMVKYLKDNPKKSVTFKMSGIKYEWVLDTGYIENI